MNIPRISSLKIMHINIQSLRLKKERLINYLEEHKIEIASINETWLKPKHTFSLKSFNIVKKDRPNRASGGVCLLIKKGIKFEVIDLTNFEEEIIGISLKNQNGNQWQIFSYYNPPKTHLNNQLLDYLSLLGNNTVLLGDLNSHHTNWFGKKSDSNGKLLTDFIHEKHWEIHNNAQYTYTPLNHCERHSVLDLVITVLLQILLKTFV